MTSKELNLKLIKEFPELTEVYYREVSWQDGDETGSHVVYEDVFVPFIKMLFVENAGDKIKKVFEYIESLFESEDAYAEEVLSLSVLESLAFSNCNARTFFVRYAKERTLKELKEIYSR